VVIVSDGGQARTARPKLIRPLSSVVPPQRTPPRMRCGNRVFVAEQANVLALAIRTIIVLPIAWLAYVIASQTITSAPKSS
jgi:hypothetical protein